MAGEGGGRISTEDQARDTGEGEEGERRHHNVEHGCGGNLEE